MGESVPISVVWFKRDLRLTDHLPLKKAIEAGRPTLLLYIDEPSLHHYPDWDIRRSRFIEQSITDINSRLAALNLILNKVVSEALEFFEVLYTRFEIKAVYSYQEIGTMPTYKRDKQLKAFFRRRGIEWLEEPTDGVQRGLQSREEWGARLHAYYTSPCDTPKLERIIPVHLPMDFEYYKPAIEIGSSYDFQTGGESDGQLTLNKFLEETHRRYLKTLSLPNEAPEGSSRLSPYLAFGNLSARQVYQQSQEALQKDGYNLKPFLSRLSWRSHFMQKFDTECRIETENFNRGFDALEKRDDEELFRAWADGETGFPLIDAAMRCLQSTGWIPFRLRATVVSFATHLLWLDWRPVSRHLAKLFLDYEPGIHYCQVQMQNGSVGTHPFRVYNPIKQSVEKDPEAMFIRKWVSEIRKLPPVLIHEPWKISPLDEAIYNFKLGYHYPFPIVKEFSKAYLHATTRLWQMKKDALVQKENERILRIHSMAREEGTAKKPEKKQRVRQSPLQISLNF